MSNRPTGARRDFVSGSRRNRGEEGSSLVLAIVFLTVVSIVMLALVQWVGNDLTNTAKFTSAQSFQSTANSAAELALQNVRYNFVGATLNASPPVPCWTTAPSPSLLSLNGQSVDAWCSTSWTIGISESRVVTISICLSSVSATSCASTPLLGVIATFHDFEKSTGISTCSPKSTTNCGTTMTIDSWVFSPVRPVVTGVVDSSFTCGSGKPVQIQGSNFTGATSVSFISTSGVSSDLVYPASSFVTVSDTSIHACTPSVGSGTAYVVVTTSAGSSAFSATYSF